MTPSKENYLKAIFEMGGGTRHVSNKEITQLLNISGASATEMNNRLEQQGLLHYIPYKGAKLTQSGLDLSIELIRKHRIWEVFLVDVLHYDWTEVHEEADRLEHASSDRLIERLYQFLGEPTHDPHGGTIPVLGSGWTSDNYMPLYSLKEPTNFVIRAFNDKREVLDYADRLGISLNESYQFIQQEPIDQAYRIINSQGDELMISLDLAHSIYIELK